MKKIAILLSGGVDSLVAAQQLKEQGHDVVGIHFTTGYESVSRHDVLIGEEDSQEKPRTAANIVSLLQDQLAIPIEILDCSIHFKKHVVGYFARTYQQGRTPNPCLVCNPLIKFGTCFSFAKKLGASCIATGHYARLVKDGHGNCHLLKGKDHRKDQSYFLAMLKQKDLAVALFPLGDLTKSETFAMAGSKGLKPVVKAESQDICFIKGGTYGEFLMQQPGFKARKGPIEDSHGNIIGEHQGLHRYTIGQRKGIDCPASEPYYVLKIDVAANKLVVGFKQDSFSRECSVVHINWIQKPPKESVRVQTRVRYRHKAAVSKLTPSGEKLAMIEFETPQAALTPGQAAVFYSGEEILGGGWIAERGIRNKE
jgi:tRNA-specific 2-thiouridylase